MNEMLVLDATCLRSPTLELYLAADARHRVVLTETACMEAYKGNSLVNLQRSLETLSRFPDRVVILKPIPTIIEQQSRGARNPEFLFVDAVQTAGFRRFLMGLERAVKGHIGLQIQIADLAGKAEAHFERMVAQSHTFIEAVTETADSYGEEFVKALRSQTPLTLDMIDRFFKATMLAAKGLFTLRGIEPPSDPAVLKESFLFRLALTGQLLANRWIGMGGIQTARKEKLRNDLLDMQYVAFATYFDGLMSEDTKMQEIADLSYYLLDRLFRIEPPK